MSVSLNVYINENLMFTELSFYEWIFVRVKKHLSDNVHFTDNRRRTSIFTRRKCLFSNEKIYHTHIYEIVFKIDVHLRMLR